MNKRCDDRIDHVESLLAQTQCQQCDYSGCRPYAEAIVSGEADIDRCIPGGHQVYASLANYLDRPVQPDVSNKIVEKQSDPWVAFIDPKRCVGCYKCVDICPQDAVVGIRGTLTTVDAVHCNGCGLCLPICPMDCINTPKSEESHANRLEQKSTYQDRYLAKQKRIANQQSIKHSKHEFLKQTQSSDLDTKKARQAAFLAAIKRRKGHDTKNS